MQKTFSYAFCSKKSNIDKKNFLINSVPLKDQKVLWDHVRVSTRVVVHYIIVISDSCPKML